MRHVARGRYVAREVAARLREHKRLYANPERGTSGVVCRYSHPSWAPRVTVARCEDGTNWNIVKFVIR
jgi:hypothetical protein